MLDEKASDTDTGELSSLFCNVKETCIQLKNDCISEPTEKKGTNESTNIPTIEDNYGR